MVHPDPDVLAGLALGDVPFDDHSDPAVGRHVASCTDCTATIGALRRVLDLAADLDTGSDTARTVDTGHLEHPAPGLWERIERELGDPPLVTPGEQPAVVLRSVRRTTSRREDRARRSTAVAWLAAAAVAGVLVGVGGAWAFWRSPTPATATTTTTTTATTVAAVGLDTLDTRQHRGDAVLRRHDGVLDLRVEMGELAPGPGYLEVWLLNSDGKRMVSIGVMSQSDSTFPVSSELLAKGYVIVDVSREAFDDRPQHSGDSLVRGRLSV